jgi:hypothetical protein
MSRSSVRATRQLIDPLSMPTAFRRWRGGAPDGRDTTRPVRPLRTAGPLRLVGLNRFAVQPLVARSAQKPFTTDSNKFLTVRHETFQFSLAWYSRNDDSAS